MGPVPGQSVLDAIPERQSREFGAVWGVAVTPDGTRAVSVSGDHTLKVLDLETGRALRMLEGCCCRGSREMRCNLNTFPTHNSLKIAENERLGIL